MITMAPGYERNSGGCWIYRLWNAGGLGFKTDYLNQWLGDRRCGRLLESRRFLVASRVRRLPLHAGVRVCVRARSGRVSHRACVVGRLAPLPSRPSASRSSDLPVAPGSSAPCNNINVPPPPDGLTYLLTTLVGFLFTRILLNLVFIFLSFFKFFISLPDVNVTTERRLVINCYLLTSGKYSKDLTN